jgi:thiamine kinase-like enzyme
VTARHNDLLNANFLLDGDHTWIVDYEYAGMGDPFFDLGNLSVNNGLDDGAQCCCSRSTSERSGTCTVRGSR